MALVVPFKSTSTTLQLQHVKPAHGVLDPPPPLAVLLLHDQVRYHSTQCWDAASGDGPHKQWRSIATALK